MSKASARLHETWLQVDAQFADWKRFRREMEKGGLPASSRPVVGSSGGGEPRMPELDEVDRQFKKFDRAEKMAHLLTARCKEYFQYARQAFGNDPESKAGRNAEIARDRAAEAAVRHLGVMLSVMDWAKPLALSEAQKLAEEAVSPTARTCANPYCAVVVERLLGERCRNCHDFLKRTGLERPERLIHRDIERANA